MVCTRFPWVTLLPTLNLVAEHSASLQSKKRAIDSNVGWEGGRVSISTSANVVLPSGSDLQAINLDLLMDGVSAVPAKSERRC